MTSPSGVRSVISWPCGQNPQLKPESHRRRSVRHEARGGGHWVLTAGLVLSLEALRRLASLMGIFFSIAAAGEV